MPRLSKIGAAALAAFGWTAGGAVSVTASYIQVAGGGGGADLVGGGGGGGGYLSGTTTLNTGLSYTIVVGAGGVGGIYSGTYGVGTNGGNSSIGALTASVGGGAGGPGDGSNGLVGGSGGGGGASSGAAGSGAAGTSGQGYAGGNGQIGDGNTTQGAGGGGGAGGAGSNATNSSAGNGGVGVASSISGTSTYYAGGGGGGHRSSNYPAGTGGNGGGGNGTQGQTAGYPGTQNTGGGGGGAGYDNAGHFYSGGNGGSGVVIIAYAGAQKFGGGIVSSDGTNTIHTFKISGTLSPLSQLSADYLVVAGGGGGSVGGGGAGGMVTGSVVTIDTNSIYLVTIGAGGAGTTTDSQGTSGVNSSFSIVSTSAVGGGGGGGYSATLSLLNGLSGGSGGGGGARSGAGQGTGGAGTSGQGNAGGNGYNNGVGGSPGGGGGGAGVVGGNASGTSVDGNGGNGLTSSLSGTSTYYAGGGGGCAYSGTLGTGGLGGGGSGVQSGTPNAGTVNTGGGGGGQFNAPTDPGGAGGSGIVIVRYAGSTQQMAGGTVTITGGYVIHTFLTSGYLTPITYLTNSLRFRSSASTYLSRTNATSGTGQGKTWTYSCWVKMGILGQYKFLLNAGVSITSDTSIYIDTNDNLKYLDRVSGTLTTTQVFRDPAAWYHIVVAYDSTQTTSSDRVKMYVNGSQVTAFGTASYPTQNTAVAIGNSYIQYIGEQGNLNTNYMDAYLAEMNFIDGQQLTPNAFGTFNSYGVWQPITYAGSYGINGYRLPFSNNNSIPALGYDFGPYQNNFTPNNFSLARSYTSLTSGSGTYTVPAGVTSLQYLVVGGGGGGGGSNLDGGGGAGGVLTGTMTVTPGQTISYVIGAGGANSTAGSNTTFGSLIAYGGGTGTRSSSAGSQNGGSGGGAYWTNTPGTGVDGQGNRGGYGYPDESSGGGGGATTPGQNGAGGQGGKGGAGLQWINGTYYGGGGGGGAYNGTGGAGGVGGGGNANNGNANGSAGTANTGGGGGGASYASPGGKVGGAGGSGIIVIATGSASTYDSMTDVPTLTSATAANYAVMNPLSKSSLVTLSNGNLTVYTASNDVTYTASSMAIVPGNKTYFELTCQTNIGANFYQGIAIWSTAQWANYDNGAYSTYWGYNASDGKFYNNGVGTTYGATWTNGDVIGVAVDMTTGSITFYKNGVSQGVATTSINTSLSYFVNTYTYTTQCSLNFGQQPFVYAPPSGFVALNTYNM